jgi:hypothetical protein
VEIRSAQQLAWQNKLAMDLQDAVEAKLAVNKARVYRRLPNGALTKDPTGP